MRLARRVSRFACLTTFLTAPEDTQIAQASLADATSVHLLEKPTTERRRITFTLVDHAPVVAHLDDLVKFTSFLTQLSFAIIAVRLCRQQDNIRTRFLHPLYSTCT